MPSLADLSDSMDESWTETMNDDDWKRKEIPSLWRAPEPIETQIEESERLPLSEWLDDYVCSSCGKTFCKPVPSGDYWFKLCLPTNARTKINWEFGDTWYRVTADGEWLYRVPLPLRLVE